MPIHTKTIPLLIFTSGLAALSWEVLWQLKAALALGVSAWGTALTLAVTMGGMAAGALAAGAGLRNRHVARPLHAYAFLEIIIALCGLLLVPGFKWIESLDTAFYASHPFDTPFIHLTGITLMLALPAFSMGATMPVIGLIARQFRLSIAGLYGLNTLGAAAGTLAAAILFIPTMGITHTAWIIAGINMIVAAAAWVIGNAAHTAAAHAPEQKSAAAPQPLSHYALIVAVTGFSIFVLEIAWFRSLTSAFASTTTAFAIMLSAVLLALGLGARMAPLLKARGYSLGPILAIAGSLVLLVTPVIERFDLFVDHVASVTPLWFITTYALTVGAVGLPVLLAGVALPWILDDQNTTRRWGGLYGLNALCAIIGALSAGWLLLPHIGAAKTAWVAGTLLAAAGILTARPALRLRFAGLATAGLLIAATFESGVGTVRVPGWDMPNFTPRTVLKSYEGPDVTVSAVEYDNDARALVIDGFVTTTQSRMGDYRLEHYMILMGHLPMLMHPSPRNALVICFGTGQTADAVRRESPERIDIVDINKNVFKLAPYFFKNNKILQDGRVSTTIMDGRAFIRRTSNTYDVITLEPMAPTFAGVNALYSREFYAQSRAKLTDDGVIAQWLPFHLVPPYLGASIVRTFQDVFPNAVLWVDPQSGTGIILGSKNDGTDMSRHWPGLERPKVLRILPEDGIRKGIALNAVELKLYGDYGAVITDDNQLLAYRIPGSDSKTLMELQKKNVELIERLTGKNIAVK